MLRPSLVWPVCHLYCRALYNCYAMFSRHCTSSKWLFAWPSTCSLFVGTQMILADVFNIWQCLSTTLNGDVGALKMIILITLHYGIITIIDLHLGQNPIFACSKSRSLSSCRRDPSQLPSHEFELPSLPNSIQQLRKVVIMSSQVVLNTQLPNVTIKQCFEKKIVISP